ncbi:ComE operon protein 3 [Liquorilactobacillus nagelii DSM 13675]|nr:ComE operon protein 3 [Liquorilactobacillus nagelii DSM 13675]
MAVVTIILLTLVYFEFNLVWVLLLVVLSIRVISFSQKNFIWIWILFGFGWMIWLGYWDSIQENQCLNKTHHLVNQHLVVEPDDIQIDGDLVKAKGKWLEDNQRLQIYYRIKSFAEKNVWQNQKKALKLKVSGEFEAVNGPTNENQFDYRRFLRAQLIVNQVFVTRLSYQPLDSRNKLNGLNDFLHELRVKLLDYLGKFSNPLKSYSQLLLLGYYNPDYDQQIQEINQLGLLYLFSLSGMHVFYLLRVFKWIFTYLRFTKESYQWFCLFLLPIYAFLGGLSPSLLRAVFMSWLIILGQRFCVKLSGLAAESLVLIINLIYAPLLIFSLGFQLSYLLTFILLESRNLNQIQLGFKLNCYSFPLILWHTYQWNLLTGFLTIAIMPIFDWLIVPAVILGTLLPVTTAAMNSFLSLIVSIFAWLAKLPAELVFGKPPIILVAGSIIILNLLEFSKKKKALWSMLIMAYLICGIIIRFPTHDEVVYFDIGQGDCTLIRRKFNQSLTLVDTGGKVSFYHESWRQRHSKTNGETVVANYLLSKGITRVDNLFLTHQDADHTANFSSIAQLIKFKRIIVPDGMQTNPSFIRRLKQSEVNPKRVLPASTLKYQQLAGLRLLHPFGPGTGTNQDSLTLWFKLENVSFIISGDLDQPGEKQVIQRHPRLRAKVLKTGHHGSKTSSALEYVAQLKPMIAIISAGKNNRYGHPNQVTLATLRHFDVPFVCTAEKGMIKVYPIAGKIKISVAVQN